MSSSISPQLLGPPLKTCEEFVGFNEMVAGDSKTVPRANPINWTDRPGLRPRARDRGNGRMEHVL